MQGHANMELWYFERPTCRRLRLAEWLSKSSRRGSARKRARSSPLRTLNMVREPCSTCVRPLQRRWHLGVAHVAQQH